MASSRPHNKTPEIVAYQIDGEPIRLVYDTWTPRPHFITQQINEQPKASDEDLAVTYRIIGKFLQTNQNYDDNAILSFHCGAWYQKHTNIWHAHLCVPYDAYLSEAKNVIRQVPSNREWNGATSVAGGFEKWRQRKQDEYNKYKAECLRTNVPNITAAERVALSTLDNGHPTFQLAWSCSTPQIAVLVKPAAAQTATLVDLYNFMSGARVDVERLLSGVDAKKFRNFGCHLCLFVRGQEGTTVTCRSTRIFTADGRITTSESVVGYIQMEEGHYLEWLPNNIRNTWREEFGNAPHFVRT